MRPTGTCLTYSFQPVSMFQKRWNKGRFPLTMWIPLYNSQAGLTDYGPSEEQVPEWFSLILGLAFEAIQNTVNLGYILWLIEQTPLIKLTEETGCHLVKISHMALVCHQIHHKCTRSAVSHPSQGEVYSTKCKTKYCEYQWSIIFKAQQVSCLSYFLAFPGK